MAPGGLAVGIDESGDAVREARKLSVEIENLMFAPGSAGEIPWQENFFSVLLCESGASPDSALEAARVLAPGGRIFIVGGGVDWAAALVEAGFDPVISHSMGGAPFIEACKPSERDHRRALGE